jgi:hypothetical protein
VLLTSLEEFDLSGLFNDGEIFRAEGRVTIIRKNPNTPIMEKPEDGDGMEIPGDFALYQNYPNPFNPETNISFFTRNATRVTVTVYNVRGQLVRTLFEGISNTGLNTVTWRGDDDNGRRVSSGLYLYKVQSNEFVETEKMMLIK